MFAIFSAGYAHAADPLPSWNDGKAKSAIVDFMTKVTSEGSPDFVHVAERIAVFDNDGTLWPENPLPFQMAFAVDEAKRHAAEDPQIAADPMVKALLAGNYDALMAGPHHEGLLQIMNITHAGMTTDAFAKAVADWISTAKHPRFDLRYVELTYQPMQEVLAYLRANGFTTYIVSGGGADFMRVWSDRVYGIPPGQVVGSTARVNSPRISCRRSPAPASCRPWCPRRTAGRVWERRRARPSWRRSMPPAPTAPSPMRP